MAKFCSMCGAPMVEGHRFCRECGAAFESHEPTAPAPSNPIPETSPTAAPAASPASPPESSAPAPAPHAEAPSGPVPQATPPSSPRIEGLARLQLAGAIIAALSVYLPWVKFPGDSFNGYEVPALFVIDFKTTTRGVELGMLVVVLAGIVLADLFVRSAMLAKVAFGAGIAVIVIGVLFIVQLSRSASDASQSLGDLLSFGAFGTIAGGAMITFVTAQSRSSKQGVEAPNQPPPG